MSTNDPEDFTRFITDVLNIYFDILVTEIEKNDLCFAYTKAKKKCNLLLEY